MKNIKDHIIRIVIIVEGRTIVLLVSIVVELNELSYQLKMVRVEFRSIE